MRKNCIYDKVRIDYKDMLELEFENRQELKY